MTKRQTQLLWLTGTCIVSFVAASRPELPLVLRNIASVIGLIAMAGFIVLACWGRNR